MQNETRTFSLQRGIRRLALPYLSQWASSIPFRQTLLLLSHCFSVDMMLSGKSRLPNRTLKEKWERFPSSLKDLGVCSKVPQLALCWGNWPEPLIDTSLLSAKTAHYKGWTWWKLLQHDGGIYSFIAVWIARLFVFVNPVKLISPADVKVTAQRGKIWNTSDWPWFSHSAGDICAQRFPPHS